MNGFSQRARKPVRLTATYEDVVMDKQPPSSRAQSSAIPPVSGNSSVPRLRPLWRWLGLGLAGVGAVVIGYVLLRNTAQNGNAQDLNPAILNPPAQTFVGWNKPDLAIIVSGEMHGYLQPCGCSDPQKGGLARRYHFMQALKDKGWPVAAIDLGDIAASSGPQQRLKYVASMKA